MERLKHWHLFLIFVLPLFLALHLDDAFYRRILGSVSLIFILIYFLTIGEYLYCIKEMKGHRCFRINCFYLVVLTVLFGNVSNVVPGEFWSIMLLLVLYALIALIHVIEHVALLIRAVEKKPVDAFNQKAEFLLLFFWPLGVWFLQPRINRLA